MRWPWWDRAAEEEVSHNAQSTPSYAKEVVRNEQSFLISLCLEISKEEEAHSLPKTKRRRTCQTGVNLMEIPTDTVVTPMFFFDNGDIILFSVLQ